MAKKRLHKGNESIRAGKIMAASRTGDAGLLPQLLARLKSNESYANKRHIIRALGKIGGREAEVRLLEVLRSERGLILGDIALALGKLDSRAGIPALKSLADHEQEWVRQSAKAALRQLGRPKALP